MHKRHFKNPNYNNIKNNKVLRNKFNLDDRDPHPENYKTLIKDIEADANEWKYILCSYFRRINTVKSS